ncbi:entericidin A/B family lipoprotein [Sphingobium nicotianae]|uniref:Entericidin A/B family lipoprotein n=1 Tax=Sphingobium nicotianae TaxID=2782607 RepID=A0A9X1IS04_9SPHN|nr:entericidin A/B family lipoprotein [Sphingobium nicotianae]MBT2187859.1 entericidin A/B family lipoprotein [Sphingobium nicotianae]
MKRNAILALLLGAAFALNACATVKGAGKDIQSVGQAGEDAINH